MSDLFDPRRLEKLWAPPVADEFEARERAELEEDEKEPAAVALELYQEIELACRRRLGTSVRPLLPILARGRELLATKIAMDRKTEPAAATPEKPPAEVPKNGAAPGADEPGGAEANARLQFAGRATSQDRVDTKLKDIFAQAKVYTGITLDDETAAAVPGELGAVLDAIEDLFGVLAAGRT